MNASQRVSYERHLRRRLAVWIKHGETLVDDFFDDARSHLDRACSEAMKNTDDGRPTAIKARGSRSYKAAEKKLKTLLTAVAGPSVSSLEGFVQDAREDFYIDSFAFWYAITDEVYRVASDEPSKADLRSVRGSLYHGASIRSNFLPLVTSAIAGSQAALVQASLSGISWKTSAQILDNWSSKRSNTFKRELALCLSGCDKLADSIAMVNVIAPPHRPEPGSSIPGS